MNDTTKQRKALDFLLGNDLSPEEKIDGMSPAEVREYLADNGINVPQLEEKARALKAKLEGKFALAKARAARLEREAGCACNPAIRIPATIEEIRASLTQVFGSFEAIPLAARGFKGMDYEEYKSLYLDIMRNRQEGRSSGNA